MTDTMTSPPVALGAAWLSSLKGRTKLRSCGRCRVREWAETRRGVYVCSTCRMSKPQRMGTGWGQRVASWTLCMNGAQVARSFGCTRQNVNQLRQRWCPPELVALQKAQRPLARAVSLRGPLRKCVACGVGFYGIDRKSGTAKVCSPGCNAIREKLRLHLTSGERDKHRLIVAKWQLAHPDECNKYMLASAQRMVDGTIGYHGRWLIKGSIAHQAAHEAFASKRPIFDLLPEPIQEQIRAEAAA